MNKFDALVEYLHKTAPEWFDGVIANKQTKMKLKIKGDVNIEELADRILAWKYSPPPAKLITVPQEWWDHDIPEAAEKIVNEIIGKGPQDK